MADEHTTRRARRDRDAHATGKAVRGQNSDTHATAKASRGSDNGPQPYDRHSTAVGIRKRMLRTDAGPVAQEWPQEFILDGVKYKNEGILSDSSGEAIVFTVSNKGKKYALKEHISFPCSRL